MTGDSVRVSRSVVEALVEYLEVRAQVEACEQPFTQWEDLRAKVTPTVERLHSFDPAALRAALAPAEAGSEGLERVTQDKVVGGLMLHDIPALRDPKTGEVFYSPDVMQTLYNVARALQPRREP